MKRRSSLWIAFLLVITTSVALAQKPKKTTGPIYAFGLSASFVDTIVYFTEIQPLENARLTSEGFLQGREQYSSQLKVYLESVGAQANATCVVYFSTDESKLAKTAHKVLSKYRQNKHITLSPIDPESFRFRPLQTDEPATE